MYSGFVHVSATDKIEFSDNIRKEFDAAIALKDLQMLEKATEDVKNFKMNLRKTNYNNKLVSDLQRNLSKTSL